MRKELKDYQEAVAQEEAEMTEIERKFLVKDNTYKDNAFDKFVIVQGYLNRSPQRTVRVRTKGEQGYITVKGVSSYDGTTRFEWEKEIPYNEAKTLLKLCELATIEKVRYLVRAGIHTFEVDEFYGVNEGLVMAEIELSYPEEPFEIPEWLGEEVTGNNRYYNSQLSKQPYCVWGNAGLFPAQ